MASDFVYIDDSPLANTERTNLRVFSLGRIKKPVRLNKPILIVTDRAFHIVTRDRFTCSTFPFSDIRAVKTQERPPSLRFMTADKLSVILFYGRTNRQPNTKATTEDIFRNLWGDSGRPGSTWQAN